MIDGSGTINPAALNTPGIYIFLLSTKNLAWTLGGEGGSECCIGDLPAILLVWRTHRSNRSPHPTPVSLASSIRSCN